MKKLKYIIPLLIAIPLVWFAVSSHADGHRNRGDRMLRGLDLTQEQREQIETIHRAAAKKSVQQQADLRLAQLDLEELMSGDEPKRDNVHNQLRKIAELQAALRITQVDQQLDVRQLLTPEQRQEMAERTHMRKGREHRRGHGEHGWGERRGKRHRWGGEHWEHHEENEEREEHSEGEESGEHEG